jgi:hypothetical protein
MQKVPESVETWPMCLGLESVGTAL